MTWILLVAFALFTGVEGLFEGIDDITNNLVTDLAPLITLCGEQATKQFLSESTSFMDSVIFSIAPLGLITAVVSVIRIYGSSSFKSIIGRSQEAHGVAEAELCSSTSQDVCELWSNGGICRVLGRPKILNFLYHDTNAKDDFYPKYKKDQRQDLVEEEPSCGIHRPHTLFFNTDDETRKKMELLGWEEVSLNLWSWSKLLSRLLGIKHNDRKTKDEPSANPNLTLNVGIRKVHKRIRWSILIFSVLLQLSFFGYAAWATFYNPSFLNEGTPSPQAKIWFGLTILGTIMMVFGMILCARLIDLKSRERRFERIGGTSEIFWLQPGGQRVGDQVFHAFAYSESRAEYITSGRVDNTKRERTLLLAVISAILGWVLQFVGLRGSPGSITLFQFIATLVMSFLRAVLRGKRLEANKNRLGHDDYKRSNLVEGHELDWQAMDMYADYRHYGWRISDRFPTDDQGDVKKEIHEGVTVISTKHFRAYYTDNNDRTTQAATYASDWIAAQEAINSTCINPAAKIMRFRSRLAKLTSVQSGLPAEQAWGGEIRTAALQLQKALQVSVEYIFAQFPLDQALEGSSAPKAIAWKSSCAFSKVRDQTSQEKDLQGAGQQEAEDHFTVGFQMYNRDGKWSISSHQLEAMLGLWSWSLKKSELLLGSTTEKYLTRSKMVVVEQSKRDDIEAALYRWVTQTRQVREYGAVSGISRADNLSIPTSSVLGRAQSSKQSSGAFRRTDTSNTDGFTISGIPTDGSTSLLQLMAQDIYTSFINRIVDIFGDLRGTGDPEDYLTMRGHSLSTTSPATPLLELTNPHIDALANALVSAGIATREEALMSIVPAFLRQTKLPLLDEDTVQNLLDWAKSLRRDLKFRQGAALILWMLSSCPARFHKQGLRCLGDLYRRAALSKKRGDQEFGISGMRDMEKRHSALALDSQTQDILGCYKNLYTFSHGRKTAKVVYEDSDDAKVIENDLEGLRQSKTSGLRLLQELRLRRLKEPNLRQLKESDPRRPKEPDIEVAISQEDLELALTLNERVDYNVSTRSNAVEKILRWALAKDFPELIEDLWTSASLPQWGCHSPLLVAFDRKCELETFHSLLDWPGTDLDAGYKTPGLGDHSRTPLLWAIDADRADVVCSILRRGAAVHQRDDSSFGMTPLHHAVQFSNITIIQLLLKKGADVNERARNGQTALHFAAKANSEAIILVLLEHRAKVNEKDKQGQTPLHSAAEANHEATILCLLENGAKVHEKDMKGQTPLHLAAANCNQRISQLLLEKGADLYEQDKDGYTALHLAAQRHNESVLRLLLEKSAENGSTDHRDWSLLWSIIPKHSQQMSQLLEGMGIKKPSDIGGKDEIEHEGEEEGSDPGM